MELTVRQFVNRYGPSLALLVTLVLLVLLVPSNSNGNKQTSVQAVGPAANTQPGQGQTATTQKPGSPTATTAAAGGPVGATPTTAGSGGPIATSGTGPTFTPGNPSATSPPGGSQTQDTIPGASTPQDTTPGGAPVETTAPVDNGGGGAPTDTTAPPQAPPADAGCRDDGKQMVISIAAPPCIAPFTGDNGGATSMGVYADHIDVAYYQYPTNPATQAALQAAGAADNQPDIDRDMDIERQYFNNFLETYKREIVYHIYKSSNQDPNTAVSDDVGAVADARKIAADKMFAVLSGGAGFNPTFNEEVIRGGVICIDCTVSQSKSYLDRTKGYDFSALPAVRDYYEQVADFWGKRLVGNDPKTGKPRLAQYALTASGAACLPTDLCAQPRKFGLIWIKSTMGKVDPGAQEERDNFVNNILPKYGIPWSDCQDVFYDYDVASGPQQSQPIIQKLHNCNVTTIVMIADPLMPVFFTKEASNEGYFPEWFISGTALTDTTFFGRTYDKAQWKNAFGISPLWVFTNDFTKTDGYREYQLMCPVSGHENESNTATGENACAKYQNGTLEGGQGEGINVYRTPPAILSLGVSLAGPNLTPATFAQGEYAFPPAGGFPELPLIYFTPDDPTIIKDFVEVWWNSCQPNVSTNCTGNDEVNKNNVGILMKSNGGVRTKFFEWNTDNPYAFAQDPKPVFTSDSYPQANFTGQAPPKGKKCKSCPNP